jgi:hypothetical protein
VGVMGYLLLFIAIWATVFGGMMLTFWLVGCP